ncbi:GYF domain-containing protein [Stenotrophomonas sp. YIM B06876]|uniref:GYF domain-containing protein n=1 Tax=Stenotrophomonas sp. YIM B06876 TaxID=3060211 RepID=UPI002738BA17|nr:GYF domain-containing protein [Stenotrophomonas sp. YIM B06876]
MGQWFYAEGNRERRGPLPGENLVELFRSGRIALDTLVWREGMDQWQPLRAFAGELGLTDPPPAELPVAPSSAPAGPPPLQATPAPANVNIATPKRGLSGCAIAGIIAAVVGVVLVALVGVLAAIAVPAYQGYTLRAKTAAAYAGMVPLKAQISTFAAEHQRCPVNDDAGFGAPESYAQAGIGSIRIGRFDNGHCGLEALLQVPDEVQLQGKAIWLDYDPGSGQWHCSAEVDDKYLPHECRG